ncbi:MAG TPA: sulfatase-like hydrolase/transferase, partial [Byssovorax sp.]
GDFGTGLATVELVATQARRGSRVLFGDPVVLPSIDAPSPPPRPAHAVVIVVVDGVERPEMPPWNAAPAPLLATFGDLAVTATVFDHHRAPTTVVPAVVASLLTGLPPREHGLVDLAARLPPSVATLATVARDASVRTAMFTGVPTTFRAFGFAEGWEKFVEFTPPSGDPAIAPIDAATAWITEVAHAANEPRMLAVVHARGGHPPWDVVDATTLPPKDYTGFVDPRRAAQTLGKMRHRRKKEPLAETDRVRIHALEQVALGGQDHAIGALVSSLKTANLWDTTLFIVTGDVSSGASDDALFGDGLPLTEQVLTLPLYVHFPGSVHAAERVKEPTEIVDLTRTVVDALGLSFARSIDARDLGRVADNPNGAASAPQIATLGERYAARWGSVVVSGRFPKPPAVCDLAVDPVCAFDRRDLMPVSTYAVFQRIVAADVAARARGSVREPATLDPETLAALNVWGSD